MSRFAIINRLEVALATVDARHMQVRAIYLTAQDHAALDRAESARWKKKLSVFNYRDHEIRRGETSRIYSTHGVSVNIPKRVAA